MWTHGHMDTVARGHVDDRMTRGCHTVARGHVESAIDTWMTQVGHLQIAYAGGGWHLKLTKSQKVR